MSRICIIFNPAARSARAKRFMKQLHRIADQAVFRTTSGPGDARLQAKWAIDHGFDTIVAAGGDGTINEVVNGIDQAPIHFGVLPVGTINVFARELGIPFNLEKAWAVILQGKSRVVDLPQANGQSFVQLAGVGFDAQIVESTSRHTKYALGPISYLLAAIPLAAQKPPRLKIYVDDKKVEGSFVVIGNGRFYAGPFMLFPEAIMDDGLLDVCIFENIDHLSLLRYFGGVLFKAHIHFPDVHYFKARSVRIESDQHVPIEFDGEIKGTLPCEFKIDRRKLQVLVP